MASRSEALPSATQVGTLDRAGVWFWNFLKDELSPYQGRAWIVARVTIAATIVMLLVMTFRLPGGFLGAIFTLLLSRENLTATLSSGLRTMVSFTLATAYTLVGVMTMVDDPLTHFLWIMITLFIGFYLIRILPDYASAVGFGFMTTGVIPFWDQALLNVNDRVENTLWLAFAVLMGSAVTIVVEYVFRRVHPQTDLTEGIDSRLETVETILREIATERPVDVKAEKNLMLFSNVGTSRLRRLLLRSGYSPHFIAQMNTAISLLGQLVDLAASLQLLHARQSIALSREDEERCLRLADEISELRADLRQRKLPRQPDLLPRGKPSNMPFLPAMERVVAFIPQSFSGSKTIADFTIPAPMDEETRQGLLVADAFSNRAHLQFALRGTLAATLCYVIYTAIDWRGLNTSIATCIITALSTLGSSRQKQFLRLGGAIVGGIVIGMGCQIFILPYIDSIAGFTLLFAAVTALSAWIGTASARLSYLGVQLALAFYIINLQEFAIQTSLAVARDRVFGVLLGLMSMWMVFDRLGVKDASSAMDEAFAKNLELFAELTEQQLGTDLEEGVKRTRQLRDQLNAGFEVVRAQSDAVLFEFGPTRRRKLKMRQDIRRWQPLLRTLLQVQVTLSQFSLRKTHYELPPPVSDALKAFESNVARVARVMANEVNRKSSADAPDVASFAKRLGQEINRYYPAHGLPIPPLGSDLIALTQNIASILTSLHEDIHSTFQRSVAVKSKALPRVRL